MLNTVASAADQNPTALVDPEICRSTIYPPLEPPGGPWASLDHAPATRSGGQPRAGTRLSSTPTIMTTKNPVDTVALDRRLTGGGKFNWET